MEAARTASAARRLARGGRGGGPLAESPAGRSAPWPLELGGLYAILGSMSPTPCQTRRESGAILRNFPLRSADVRCTLAASCLVHSCECWHKRLELCSLLKGLRQAAKLAISRCETSRLSQGLLGEGTLSTEAIASCT